MIAETARLEALRIIGGVGTGKTEQLMNRITALVSQGVEPTSIVAFCATPLACRAFRARLRKHAGNTADQIHVTTPRSIALEILDTSEAIAFTGREPHLLTPFEETFLLEDMKVCGLKPRRLKEMIKFFYRSWTELADDNPDWLLPGEEASTHELLKANLSFMRALVESEVANLAVNYLRSKGESQASWLYEHVVVDDYQLLSRASQTLTNLVASRSIAIAGDPNACLEVYDTYPYAEGLIEFLETYPQATKEILLTCQRSHATTRAAKHLLADPSMAPFEMEENPQSTSGCLDTLRAEDPADEFSRIADLVAEAIEQGTPTAAITIAVPNTVWGRNVTAFLASKGVPAETLPNTCPIRGDIRNNKSCVEARIATALDLVANPYDAAAWRCWCGYGDHLVNSASFAHLRTRFHDEGIGLVEALATLAAQSDRAAEEDEGIIVGSQRVAAAYRTGRALIARTQHKEGAQLLDEITRAVTNEAVSSAPFTIAALCLHAEITSDNTADTPTNANTNTHTANEPSGEDASVLARRLRQRLLVPALQNQQAVAVVPYPAVAGLSPDLLIITGFVNGFIPCRDYFDAATTPLDKQEKMHTSDLRRVYALVGKANRQLVISYFSSTDLESAGKLKLKINRIRLRNSVRTCTIEPSTFLPLIAGE